MVGLSVAVGGLVVGLSVAVGGLVVGLSVAVGGLVARVGEGAEDERTWHSETCQYNLLFYWSSTCSA